MWRALARLSSPPTPPFSLATMPSFQAVVWARSIEAEPAVMPACRRLAAFFTASNLPAAWMKALDGMQPTFRQVPPSLPASTMTVSSPSWPQRMAQG
jgi:hypothetical protein